MPIYHNDCPYVARKSYGDEVEDHCDMTGHICLLELGQHCATWAEIQKEWERQGAAALALAPTLPDLFPSEEPITATPMTATILDREWRHKPITRSK